MAVLGCVGLGAYRGDHASQRTEHDMSMVTDVLLVVHYAPSDELVAAIEAGRFSGGANGNVLTEITPVSRVDGEPGGYGSGKGADARIWASGFNNARPAELGAWFASLPWGWGDNAVLTASLEGDEPADVWVKIAGCRPMHVYAEPGSWSTDGASSAIATEVRP